MQERSLRQIIDDAGRIPAEQALDIAGRAARAIEVIHENGNVHGSIRADTLLIGPHGTVSVDESALSAEARTTTTHELDAATTDVVAYFSPEQARNLEIDQRSDLYSLGVVLFEMLTGSVPFQASSAVAVAYEHATVPPPRLDEAHPDIPTQLADIVDKALAKDADDRFQSAAEMSSALAGAHEELGPAIAPAPALSAAGNGPLAYVAPARPHWPRVAMASLVMLLAAVSAAGILPMLPASERSADDPSAVGAESDDLEGTLDEFAGDRADRVGARSGETGPGEAASPPSTSATGPSPPTTSPSATTPTIITAPTTTIAPTVTTQPTATTTEPTTTTAPTTTTTAPTTSTSETSIVTTTQPTTTTTESTTTTAPTTTTTVPTTSSTEPQP